jgi:pimeloyl-ACP methyl ester carboxylesterase
MNGGPKFLLARKWLNRYLADADVKYLQSQSQMVRSAPDFSSQDFQDWIAGLQFSMDLLYPAVATMDLPKTAGNGMPVPFFIIQGEEDHITPTDAAAEYFRAIHAPRKEMSLIKGAGHFAYATHQKEFLADLVQYITPLAIGR